MNKISVLEGKRMMGKSACVNESNKIEGQNEYMKFSRQGRI